MNDLKKKLQTLSGGFSKKDSATYVPTVLNNDKLVLDSIGGGLVIGTRPSGGGSGVNKR